MLPDTIAAIATPLGGEGGIGVVRISGPKSLRMIKSIFKNSSKEDLKSHKIHMGWIIDSKRPIDQVMVSFMGAPRSYTGEDVIEISCHGGSVVTRNILELVISAGARLAERGEFTKRAFMNGKIDLTQAEAVVDLIKAKTSEGSLFAAAQLKGALSSRIRELRHKLIGLMAEIEASIDFPDEIEDINMVHAGKAIRSAVEAIGGLIKTAEMGKIYREGISIAIVGRPNVGKSSLLNALLREERAIVHPEPGTTRDIIEETLNIKGVPVRIMDTAGMRNSKSEIERIGVDRAGKAMEKAEMALIVMDIAQRMTPEDNDLLRKTEGMKRIVALNKSDLKHRLKRGEIQRKAGKGTRIIEISALKGTGIGGLESEIYKAVTKNKVVAGNADLMINLRHRESLIRANEHLANCLTSIKNGMQADFMAIDLKGAIAALGEVTGEVASEEVIDRIFEEFCVGK